MILFSEHASDRTLTKGGCQYFCMDRKKTRLLKPHRMILKKKSKGCKVQDRAEKSH